MNSTTRNTPGGQRPEAVLIYGIHPVLEKLRAAPGDIMEILMVRGDRGPALRRVEQAALREGCRVKETDGRALDALARGGRHQGVMARAVPFAYGTFDDLLSRPSDTAGDCILFLDGVVDPRNLGSILRTAEAMGVRRVVLPKDRAAGVTGAVIKASAGAAHHLEVYRVPNLPRALAALRERGFWVVGLDAEAPDRVWEQTYPARLAVVLGGEERGLRPLVRRGCDYLVSIPMEGRVGSLNVGVAWGIFAYEVAKQRMDASVPRPG
ncbi:MAG: 23S rRNA (guanosine(2251)-2'-O)-methyltransferase RlmB [Deltaproteobacteria bacterium]|nr:23S rRNA (guanosine(2251)-2'-O)-methyltransferase RlmB [Deltaproteobacteria bacterium]